MASTARIDELRHKFEENPRRYFAPLANEYRKAGDLSAAIALCREQLAQQPSHMSGHIVLGQALYEAGQLDDARTTFEKALALDPENLIALRHLGDIARVQGDADRARRWYERVLDADPRNDDIAAQLASLADRAGFADPHAGQGYGAQAPGDGGYGDAYGAAGGATYGGDAGGHGGGYGAAYGGGYGDTGYGADTGGYSPYAQPAPAGPPAAQPAASPVEPAPLDDFDALLTSALASSAPAAEPESLESLFMEPPAVQPPAPEAVVVTAEMPAPAPAEAAPLAVDQPEPRAPEPAAPRTATPAAPLGPVSPTPRDLPPVIRDGPLPRTEQEDAQFSDWELPAIGDVPGAVQADAVRHPVVGLDLPPAVAAAPAAPAEPPAPAAPAYQLPVSPAEGPPPPLAELIVPVLGEPPVGTDVPLEPVEPTREGELPPVQDGAFATATMAELFVRQGHPERALDIYRRLEAAHPADVEVIRMRIAELEADVAGPPPEPEAPQASSELVFLDTGDAPALTPAPVVGDVPSADERAAATLAGAYGAGVQESAGPSLLEELVRGDLAALGVSEREMDTVAPARPVPPPAPPVAPAASRRDDPYSFDRFFVGLEAPGSGAAAAAPTPVAAAPAAAARPAAQAELETPAGEPGMESEEDLAKFHAWLRGLRDA